jgi:hypothetical protein
MPVVPLHQRFWAKVRVTRTCWLWCGAKHEDGYGFIGVFGRGWTKQSHRVAWWLSKGAIPDGLSVLHNCPGGDNPACVNPDHLWLGTHTDNMRDASRKGRLSGRRNRRKHV